MKIKLLIIALFVCGISFGQTTIFNVAGGGSLPSGWTGNNLVAGEVIDKGSYYLVEASSPSDNIVTSLYDLSSYSTAIFTTDVATFGSGVNNPAKIEISYDGVSYTQITTSATPTSPTYVTSTSILLNSALTNKIRIRISNNGTSGKGVRLQNIKLVATLPPFTSTAAGGEWSSAGTWVLGNVPSAGATVNIVGPVNINNTTGQINNTGTGIININDNGTLSCGYTTGASLTGTGTVNVNGTGILAIEQLGWPGTTNTYNYGNVTANTGTLKFNNTSGSYGVNASDNWFTATIPNVNVAGAGGITMNVSRTVGTLFQTASNVVNPGNITIGTNGTLQLNSGYSFSGTGSPKYGSSSLLKYNSGGTPPRSVEWNQSSGTIGTTAGYPNNVQISGNTTLNMDGTAVQCAGYVLIDASSVLNSTTGGLTVLKDVTINGTLNTGGTLNVTGTLTNNGTLILGGDVTLSGTSASNFVVGNSATQNNNGKAVFFTGASGDQMITKTGGGNVFFDYLVLNKATGKVMFNSSPATTVTINTTSGNGLQLQNAQNLDLNGQTLTLNNNGGVIYVSGAGIISSSNVTAGKVEINGTKTVSNNSGTGTLLFSSNVILNINTNGIFDFGNSGGIFISTVNGTLNMNSGNNSFVINNPPFYGSGSKLVYKMGGIYGRGFEWRTTSGAGYPYDVQVTNSTALDFPNTAGVAFSSSIGLSNNLTIDALSSFFMDYGGNSNKSGKLYIGKDLTLAGNLSLGNANGGDLFVGGSWTRTGVFTPNNRLVTFNGTSAQTLNGITTFDYLTIDNTAGVTLANNIVNNFTLNFTNGKLILASNNITIGSSGTITNATGTKYVVTNGAGKLIKLGVDTNSFVFPIGFSISNYTPITLTNTTGTSDLSVSVNQTITNTVTDASKIVTLEWGVASSAATTATASPTWQAINQAASFTNTGAGELGNYTSSYTTYPVVLSATTTTATGVALQSGSNLIVVANIYALNSAFLAISGTTAHGTICPNTAATSQTYTITNSGRTDAIGVTVVSNDAQFVVSGLSSTTIAKNGGSVTYTVTFTPTSSGAKTATITVASTTLGSNSPTSTLNGTGATSITQTVTTAAATLLGASGATLGASASTFGVCPNTTLKGFVISQTSTNATPVIGGSGVTNEAVFALGTQGSYTKAVTGLVEATNYSFRAYLYDGTTYTYSTILTFTTLFSGTLNNVTATKACLTDVGGTISWTVPTTGVTPTGYMVFAVTGASTPSGTTTTALTDYTNANTNYASATNNATPTTLGKLLYKGNGNSVDITGLSETTNYSFLVLSYQDGGSIRRFSSGATSGRALDVPAQDDVKTFTSTPSNNQVTLNWTYYLPTSCFDEVIIVANQGAVVFTPSGNGSAYTANDVYSSPNQVVYKGSTTSKAITGFINQVEYCFKIFVRRGTQWSDGTSICATPDVIYCASLGSTADATGITKVEFNTINQSSTGANSYTDFTSVITAVKLGETIPLTVRVNTAGSFTVYTRAWIDWNHNGSFNDSGEEFNLGTVFNKTDGITSLSPIDIIVPNGAYLGNVRMRISAKFNSVSTSCETFAYGEVEDYTLSITQPVNAEINVKGGTISIPNGFDSPYGLNNTLFLITDLNTDSVEKEFTIENIGVANLLLTGSPIIKIEGANPLDFIVTQQATTPVVNGTAVTFKIKFRPTVAGLRTANVRIENNDSDENPFIFAIEGTGNCIVAPTITAFPTSGPRNTLVTFSSATNNLTGATVTYNNVAIPISTSTTDKLEVFIPNNANNGTFEIKLATGCIKTQAFDVLDYDITSCEGSGGSGGSSNATDLIIYELYDVKVGSGGYITIFNRTGSTVNLGAYSINRAKDYGGNYSTYANLSGTLAAGSLAIIGVNTTDPNCNYLTTPNGSFGSGFNANDGIRLMKGLVTIDDVHAPNYTGYYLRRKNAYLSPQTVFVSSEWTDQALTNGQCLSQDEVGQTPILKFPPTVTQNPQYVVNCGVTSTTLTVGGTEGFSGGLALAYQWYALGTSGNWTAVANSGVYSGATTTTLTISNITGLDDYQYYCQIRENSATCYTATNATLVRIPKKTWNGAAWSGNGLPPTSSEKVIIQEDLTLPYTLSTITYNTLEACECQVNTTKKLIVGNVLGTTPATLIIQGNLTNNGLVTIYNNSSLVQVNENAVNTSTGIDNFIVHRITKVKNYDYVYWSSPVDGFDVSNLPDNNRYYWGPTAPNSNPLNNQGNWLTASGEMTRGQGYIARISNASPTVAVPTTLVFEGKKPFNGQFNVPIARGSTTGTDDTWNLVGNPYPSAIDAEQFLVDNTNIEGSVRIWTHGTAIALDGSLSPFYQYFTYNYDEDDYIIYNATATSKPNTFGGKIASGQGFFIRMLEDGETDVDPPTDDDIPLTSIVTFKNSYRRATDNSILDNSNFFKSSNTSKNIEKSRIWLDLIASNKQISKTVIGYVPGATLAKDRLYDALIEVASFKFYSLIHTQKQAIQGRPAPLDTNDLVPMGMFIEKEGSYTIAISAVDGIFIKDQNIFLEDKSLNTIHDLRKSPYEFTSSKGEFNNRFVLRYTNYNTLGNVNFVKTNQVIVSTNKSQITITSKAEAISQVQIFDILGRRIYDKKNVNSTVYSISDLAKEQVLIVKVKLQNGDEISDKIIVK